MRRSHNQWNVFLVSLVFTGVLMSLLTTFGQNFHKSLSEVFIECRVDNLKSAKTIWNWRWHTNNSFTKYGLVTFTLSIIMDVLDRYKSWCWKMLNFLFADILLPLLLSKRSLMFHITLHEYFQQKGILDDLVFKVKVQFCFVVMQWARPSINIYRTHDYPWTWTSFDLTHFCWPGAFPFPFIHPISSGGVNCAILDLQCGAGG